MQSRLDEATANWEAVVDHGDRDWIIAWLKRLARARTGPLASRPTAQDGEVDPALAQVLWCCERLSEMAPDEPTTLLLQTMGFLAAGRYDEAGVAFDAALENGPEQLMIENFKAMAAVPSTAVRSGPPGGPAGRGSFGSRSGSRGSLAEGTPGRRNQRSAWLIDRLIEVRPDDWWPLVERAKLALQERRFDDAFADIDRAAELGPAVQIAKRLQPAAVAASRLSRLPAGAEDDDPFEKFPAPIRLLEKVATLDPAFTASGV